MLGIIHLTMEFSLMNITIARDLTVNQNLVAGCYVGDDEVHVRVSDTVTNTRVFEQHYQSGDFRSLDMLLDRSLLEAGYIPRRIVMAIAGPRQANGNVRMTHQHEWPLFELGKTATRLGVVVETVDDTLATAAGLTVLIPEEQKLLKKGKTDPNGMRLVITLSADLGDAILLPNGTSVATKGGRATWQPMTTLEDRYLKSLRIKYGTTTVTVEEAIGGAQGFRNLYTFLEREAHRLPNYFKKLYWPDVMLTRHIESAMLRGKNLGRIIAGGALAGDPFCRNAMDIFGSILGQYVRNRTLDTMSGGGVYFAGSIIQAEGVADYIVAHTPFLKQLVANGADAMKAVLIYVVTDSEIAINGAEILATKPL